MPEDISVLFGRLKDGPDHRWAGPTHTCLCGADMFAAFVKFHDSDIAWYATTLKCAACGALCSAPTPVDEEVSGG